MSSRRRSFWPWLLAALLVVALVASSYQLLRTRQGFVAPGIDRLRIALPVVPHAALLHIAAEQGYFAAQGLDVSLLPVTHGKVAMERLAAGDVDIAAMSDVVFLRAVLRGEQVAVLASMLNMAHDNAIVARRDRNIAVPRDLTGKRIGVSFGTSAEYYLWSFLVRHRLAPESVTLVDVPPKQIATELAKGNIDATATWTPILAEAQAALTQNALLFAEPNAYRLDFLLVGGSGFLQAHPQVAQKLVRAMLQAEQYQRLQPQAALKLLATWLKVDARALQPYWTDFHFKVELRQSQLNTLEDQARWAMARGHTPTRPLPNLLPNLYLDALLEVQPERVTVVH